MLFQLVLLQEEVLDDTEKCILPHSVHFLEDYADTFDTTLACTVSLGLESLGLHSFFRPLQDNLELHFQTNLDLQCYHCFDYTNIYDDICRRNTQRRMIVRVVLVLGNDKLLALRVKRVEVLALGSILV